MHGNTNAPKAITLSAIIYSLRCLVERDVPLNQGELFLCLVLCVRFNHSLYFGKGVMAPIEVIIPEPSILHPSGGAGVVGGNVLTSQRVTDVILEAFGAAANSQGCMSNFTFGRPAAQDGQPAFGYYETIAGGAGAGPNWNGESAVQCHMTNTAITDVEVLERAYPVILRRFAIRAGSGGAGAHRGGDGVIREIEFRCNGLSVGILSERRALR